MHSKLNYILMLLMVFGLLFQVGLHAQSLNTSIFGYEEFVSQKTSENSFELFSADHAAPLFVDDQDEAGILRVAGLFGNDILSVSGNKPELFVTTNISEYSDIIIVGSVGKSRIIQKLAEDGKISIDDLKGKWEASSITVVKNPFPGVDRALVIAGSDKRGTIYGMFELSRQIGVSPWHWWADVPVEQHEALFVNEGSYLLKSPKVKYRGIFINDEEPALGGWVRENFDDFNAQFYDKVFELILRMKGNFLWPAMWGKAFYDDDPRNADLADEYGIVINTTHHEPMMRAHVEWDRYGKGPWDYTKNPEKLQKFWREGIERMGDNESIVTVGMRGDGDEPMSTNRNIEVLSKIIDDQREIIAEVTGKPAKETPQIWALYKEVQDYYDMGMRVDEDIMLLYCDDNWGNIRRVPGEEEKRRVGGSGMYYHFDYVGGPRNYKWLNTSPLSRVWEQMKLSYNHGIDELWVVNVGDLKPMELPIQFFLDLAWNPDAFGTEELDAYTQYWAGQQFGEERADAIARFLDQYTKFNGRRKPELISPETYSLTNYREAERVVGEYNHLAKDAHEMYETLPDEMKAAYYQLVLFPIEACSNLNQLYYTAAKNHRYASQGRTLTNVMADSVKILFERDAELTNYFHTEMADGKWNHMMAQTHIGYTYWQQPEQNNIPETTTIKLPEEGSMGISMQGSEQWWPDSSVLPELPATDEFNRQKGYFEIFNRGQNPIKFNIASSEEWLKVSELEGSITHQKRIWLSIDWDQIPAGKHKPYVAVKYNEQTIEIVMPVEKLTDEEANKVGGFVENDGFISIEAHHFTEKYESNDTQWVVIPDLGRTSSGVMIHPTTANDRTPGEEQMLEYPVHFKSKGQVTIHAYFSPTLNYTGGEGFKYAVGLDDEEPVVVNIHKGESHNDWQGWVANNINIKTSKHEIQEAGNHILRFYMVDPGLVLQKIVIDAGGFKVSYLGPPESAFVDK